MRILVIIIFLISANVSSQDALKINYGKQTTIDFKNDAEEENDEFTKAFKEAMKEVRHYEMLLYDNEAEYVFKEKINNQQKGGISMSFGSLDEKIYSNYNTAIQFKSYTANGKFNIIKSELPTYDWKLTRETKELLGIKVRKATSAIENGEIIAWYSTDIPYKAGPDTIWGLPGLILEYIKTTSIEVEDVRLHVFV